MRQHLFLKTSIISKLNSARTVNLALERIHTAHKAPVCSDCTSGFHNSLNDPVA